MPICLQFLNNPQQNNWKEKYSGLMVIGLLIEGSSKYFEEDFTKLMEIVLPIFSNQNLQQQNPKVLWAALTCLGLLIDEYTPKLQTDYHKPVLASIFQILQENQQHLKIKTRAVSS